MKTVAKIVIGVLLVLFAVVGALIVVMNFLPEQAGVVSTTAEVEAADPLAEEAPVVALDVGVTETENDVRVFNFTLEDLKNIVSVCSEKGVKTYLTVNTVIYNQELEKMRQVIDCAGEAGVTAIIASDLAAILYARSVGVEVHISTQCNVTNFEVVRFFAQYADVIVLAREVVLEQVMEIHRRIVEEDLRGPNGRLIKIEMFAHGALCMAVSGKCYLSLHEKNASANRGACNQICRRAYTVKDRENEVELDIENEYIMSPKDLCTIGFINKMIDAGVRVFKIEGRARSAEYVRTVCECYNEAINAYLDDTYSADKIRIWKERLATVFNRGFWNGYYLGATVRRMERGIWLESDEKENSAWQSDQLFYQFAGRRV